MSRDSIFQTRWFALSGRELIMLAVGVALALGAIGAAMGVRAFLWRRDTVAVQGADAVATPARINVNTATESELILLPRVGPKTARAITAYRNEHGPFADLDSLADVPGIGPQTVRELRPHAMCVPPPDRAGEE